MSTSAPKEPTGLRNQPKTKDGKPKDAAWYSRLTPGVLAAQKIENPPNPDLVRLAHSKATKLLKERLKGSVLTRIPVFTSLEGKGPFEIIRPEPAEPSKPKWAGIDETRDKDEDTGPRPPKPDKERGNVEEVFNHGRRYRVVDDLGGWVYAFVQLYIYTVYWFAGWLGADVRRPGKWRQLAFRYPPVEGGWDFFNIRAEYESLTRSNVIYTKRKIWFNPETGRYETVTFTNLDDETQYQDRYPGETDGLDPIEFAKYHYLEPDDTAIKWLGEKIFTPIMTIFVAFITFLVGINGIKIVISVGHLLAVENPDIAAVVAVVLCIWFGLKVLRRLIGGSNTTRRG
ncbi:hypothetical protein TWF506_005471 [Arthrobotrys conoides]|uniref:Uncharacterized protein n=1 Tax=Arthrobotrys conoides TaxID=74498 RepID=A0AAN8NU67_9PEZI